MNTAGVVCYKLLYSEVKLRDVICISRLRN
jgi:hypothetical protein